MSRGNSGYATPEKRALDTGRAATRAATPTHGTGRRPTISQVSACSHQRVGLTRTGLALATETPARHGYSLFGRHGRFYKLALVVRPGATVTVTIGASARGHAVIDAGGTCPAV